jgi:2-hydroxy-3-keto-5-methylthiopentenyl-1-phosphate phosphatase
MIKDFEPITQGILTLIEEWEPELLRLSNKVISERRNSQNRSIKQIVGHMIDSASNNTHRIIHLQYQQSPLIYPDYANNGNNDRWIAIQNYQEEEWNDLIQLWKYSNIHLVHVIQNVNIDKLENEWISALNNNVSLKEMILDYLSHFKLHLGEIYELINND